MKKLQEKQVKLTIKNIQNLPFKDQLSKKSPVQRGRSKLINLTSTSLPKNLKGHNGHVLNHVDHYDPIHFCYNHDRTDRSTTLTNHSLAQDDGTNVILTEHSPTSYLSPYNRRIIRKRRDQRQLRYRFMSIRYTSIQITHLPLQITNNQSINEFFNGLPSF